MEMMEGCGGGGGIGSDDPPPLFEGKFYSFVIYILKKRSMQKEAFRKMTFKTRPPLKRPSKSFCY